MRLTMHGITKSYPGVQALKGVDFELRSGEIHALVGENGAGKSTLMKILAGAEPRDSGTLQIEGHEIGLLTPTLARHLGVAIIYQEFQLLPALSVAENLFLGQEPRTPRGTIDSRRMHLEATALLERLRCTLDPRQRVGELAVAQQQLVEIAKALRQEAKILVMDEPSAPLTGREVEALFTLIRQLRAEGHSIVYISHRLDEVFALSDRVTVLRDGAVVATYETQTITPERLITDMVGRELAQSYPPRTPVLGAPLLEVRHLSRAGALDNISLTVHAGELVGLAGLVGAGRTELVRCLFGADRFDTGDVLLDGKPLTLRSPRDAIRHGIGLVTEDRKQQGLVLGMAVRENSTLTKLESLARFGVIASNKEQEVVGALIRELHIKTPSPEQRVGNLSGGNQQKVVLAKWLFSQSRVLLIDEPTRGIDVGARYEIYEFLNRLTAQGLGILMISSDLPEVLGMSDRVLVMSGGRIAGELSREDATAEAVMRLATS